MNTLIRRASIFVLLSFAVCGAGGASLVREFSGTESLTTADFDVDGPWILDWRANGDFPAMLGFEVALIDAKSGAHLGRVVKITDRAGDGIRLFEDGGRYRLRINSTLARWTIKIEEVSEQDRARYTPKDSR